MDLLAYDLELQSNVNKAEAMKYDKKHDEPNRTAKSLKWASRQTQKNLRDKEIRNTDMSISSRIQKSGNSAVKNSHKSYNVGLLKQSEQEQVDSKKCLA